VKKGKVSGKELDLLDEAGTIVADFEASSAEVPK